MLAGTCVEACASSGLERVLVRIWEGIYGLICVNFALVHASEAQDEDRVAPHSQWLDVVEFYLIRRH